MAQSGNCPIGRRHAGKTEQGILEPTVVRYALCTAPAKRGTHQLTSIRMSHVPAKSKDKWAVQKLRGAGRETARALSSTHQGRVDIESLLMCRPL